MDNGILRFVAEAYLLLHPGVVAADQAKKGDQQPSGNHPMGSKESKRDGSEQKKTS
jgi:hypothetical protein